MSSVYFLSMHNPADSARDFGLVKVGITDGDVADRIAQLQTGNPYELRCIDAFETSCAREVEHFVHRTHAEQMQQLEWLRWPRDGVAQLVAEASEAARRIESRKSKEDGLVSRASNGKERRADSEELNLHRKARVLELELKPANLHLVIATGRLKAATGATHGIPGIVRVTHVEATTRFSAPLAEATFPELFERCRVEKTSGGFRWRHVPKPSDFTLEKQSAAEATALAEASANRILAGNFRLDGWTPRTKEMEKSHDEFLRATQIVNRLGGHLADIESELTVRLGEYDALTRVCSYIRRLGFKFDEAGFRKAYPDEAMQCAEPIAAQLRKHVYPTRSYW